MQFIIDSSLKCLNLKTEQTIESIMFIPYSSSLLLAVNLRKHVKRDLCKLVKAPKANIQLLVKIHADSKNVALFYQRLHFIFSVKRSVKESVKGSVMLKMTLLKLVCTFTRNVFFLRHTVPNFD